VGTATALTLGTSAFYLDRSLHRVDALADHPDRVGPTPGVNWLLAGTDSHRGAPRADTLILVHIPRHLRASIVSIPRESILPIPGHGLGRIDEAFAMGGQQLLVAAIEGATGLRIDHFAQIGFAGFDSVVDDVGGVDMCLPQPMDDPLAGVRLAAGCDTLDGPQALGFVRSRVTSPGDSARMDNQRRFLRALLDRITTPSTYLHPTRLWDLAHNGTDAITVARGDHLWDLARLGLALRDNPVTAGVPIARPPDAVAPAWDSANADRLFHALANDRAIPADLVTTL
jgi:LCP family protein required for cell wall assembly